MSRGDIPIIVDACISFVTQHGEWVLANTEPAGDGGHGHSQRVWSACKSFVSRDYSLTAIHCISFGKLLYLPEPQLPHP